MWKKKGWMQLKKPISEHFFTLSDYGTFKDFYWFRHSTVVSNLKDKFKRFATFESGVRWTYPTKLLQGSDWPAVEIFWIFKKFTLSMIEDKDKNLIQGTFS